MAHRSPERVSVAPVQRLRIRYAKRGRLRFTSHRDFQRALERALRRSRVPMAYSAGFSPHPRISYANAAPTGAASEAEYFQIAVVQRCDPAALHAALDESLPEGLDILEVVEAGTDDLAGRLQASEWLVELPGESLSRLQAAWSRFLAAPEVAVSRMTKAGPRTFDARGAVVFGEVSDQSQDPAVVLVLRHGVPAVRPDDVLQALEVVAGFRPVQPARMTRLAQGELPEPAGVPAGGRPVLGDPLAADRRASGDRGSVTSSPAVDDSAGH